MELDHVRADEDWVNTPSLGLAQRPGADELVRVLLRIPRGHPVDRVLVVGACDDVGVAAPATGGDVGLLVGQRGLLQDHSNLELAEGVGVPHRPVAPERSREVVHLHVDRLLAFEILLGVEDLLRAGGRIGEGGVDSSPATVVVDRLDEGVTFVVGEDERLPDESRRGVERRRVELGVVGFLEIGVEQVRALDDVSHLGERGVAFDERGDRQALIV